MLFLLQNCQDNEIDLENTLSEKEWEELKELPSFIEAYNTLPSLELIMNKTNLTYEQLLEYTFVMDGKTLFQTAINKSGLESSYITQKVTVYNAILAEIFNSNEKLKNSEILQQQVVEKIQLYTTILEVNMSNILKEYEENLEERIKKDNRFSSRLPRGWRLLFGARTSAEIKKCLFYGGTVFRPGICAIRHYKLNEVVVNASPKSRTPNKHNEVVVNVTPKLRAPIRFPNYNPYRYGSGIRPPGTRPTRPPIRYGGGSGYSPNKVIDNTRNPCVSNIIKTLKQRDLRGGIVPDLKGKTHLSQMILDLFDKSTRYNLTIDIKQLNYISPNANGNTRGFNISLDTDLVKQATQLSIAKTLIHESLHAYIHYMVRAKPNSNFTKDLKIYFGKFGNKSNLTEHQFMGQYVEALAYSLSAYGSHKQNMDYYKAMSWGGLESSNTYKSLSYSEKTKIQQVINNERFNKRGAKSVKCN